MTSIAIYGTGACAKKLITFLNNDSIKYFVETNPKQECFMNIPLLSLNDLKNSKYKFDYLIIASSYKNEIIKSLEDNGFKNKQVIVFEERFIEYFYSEIDLHNKLDELKDSSYDLLALGLSYTRDGINSDFFDGNAINFSFSSQDLLADYEILSFLDENEYLKGTNNLILGLGYYSFHHDMSKTKYKDVIARYLTLSKNERMKEIDMDYLLFKSKISNLLLKFDDIETEKIVSNKHFDGFITEERIIEGIELANKHSIMNHPQTKKENLEYLNKILGICSRNSIKVFITVFPTDENYYKYITEDCKKNFYKDLDKFLSVFEVEVIDLLKSPQFSSEDFWDTSHVNIKGSKKIAEIIKTYI